MSFVNESMSMIRSKTDKWATDVTGWCPKFTKRHEGRQYRRWADVSKWQERVGRGWQGIGRCGGHLGGMAREQHNHGTGV